MSTSRIRHSKVKQALKDIDDAVENFTRNSLTVVIYNDSDSMVEIQMNFDDSSHLNKKLVKMFNTSAFGKLLAMHCKGETFGAINISIGINDCSDPFV